MRSSPVLLTAFLFASTASAQLTPTPLFVGQYTEEFDNGFTTVGAYCAGMVGNGIFQDHGSMCAAPGTLWHTPYAWLTRVGCVINPVWQSNALFGCIWGWPHVVFGQPAQRFGGYFANVSYIADANLTFYDSADQVIATQTIALTPCAGWVWYGWDAGVTGPKIKRVEIKGRDPLNNYSMICLEDLQYDPYVGSATFGSRCSGSLGNPGLAVNGPLGLGNTITFTPSNIAAPGAVLFAGFSNTQWNGTPLPISLAPIGGAGCNINIALDEMVYVGPTGPMPVAVPQLAVLLGATVYWQAAFLNDPSGRPYVTTRGIATTLW